MGKGPLIPASQVACSEYLCHSRRCVVTFTGVSYMVFGIVSPVQVCLVLVGGSRVWAGSMDCMIYIIGRLDRLCYQTLAEHHHIICDIICTEDDRYVI